MRRFGGGSSDHHTAGGGGRLRGRRGWLVGNGNSHNVAPDIDICDGLTLVAFTWRIIGARS